MKGIYWQYPNDATIYFSNDKFDIKKDVILSSSNYFDHRVKNGYKKDFSLIHIVKGYYWSFENYEEVYWSNGGPNEKNIIFTLNTYLEHRKKNNMKQDFSNIKIIKKKYKTKIDKIKFIHITKCAGSTIENIGKDNNILWGRYHKEYGWWHEIFINKPTELKLKYDWFVVVRNPYERLISEFYCKWNGLGNSDNINNIDKKGFNLFIKNRILTRSQKGNHYTEQYKYIDNNATIHIIHFENIESEFNELMKKYKLNINLNRRDNQCKHKKKFTKFSFSPELIKLINKIYHKDFIKFGYEKI